MVTFDISKIKFSQTDLEKGIVLPRELSPELSEIIGIHIGDGNIYYRGRSPEFAYSGNATCEKEYYEYISNLYKRVFSINVKPRTLQNNVYSIRIYSKALFLFFTQCLNIPYGYKANKIDLPTYIKTANKKIVLACVRGIMDTDFSLCFKKKHKKVHYYPVLTAGFASKKLVETLEDYLKKFGFTVTTCKYSVFDRRFNKKIIGYKIDLNGNRNIALWYKLIGTGNPLRKERYLTWKKFGFVKNYGPGRV